MLKIVTFGDKILNQESKLITEINDEIVSLANEMFATMYANNGIGLAAVQVGKLLRMFVVGIEDIGEFVMINPRILDTSLEKSSFEEGCLSIPGIADVIERPESVVVEYTDIKGKSRKIEASGILATCIQHENDHLNGVLFIDRLPPEKKIKKISEFKRLHVI